MSSSESESEEVNKFAYAYVKFYDDNVKCTVKTADIKKFQSRYHKPGNLYMVKWTPKAKPKAQAKDGEAEGVTAAAVPSTTKEERATAGYYRAQILLLADSEAEIKRRLEHGRRLQVPKILDSSVEETDEEGGKPGNHTNIANVPAAAALQKKIRAAQTTGKRTALDAILKQKMEAKKRKFATATCPRPSLPPPQPPKPQEPHDAAVESSLVQVVASLRAEKAILKKKLHESEARNRRLQGELLDKIPTLTKEIASLVNRFPRPPVPVSAAARQLSRPPATPSPNREQEDKDTPRTFTQTLLAGSASNMCKLTPLNAAPRTQNSAAHPSGQSSPSLNAAPRTQNSAAHPSGQSSPSLNAAPRTQNSAAHPSGQSSPSATITLGHGVEVHRSMMDLIKRQQKHSLFIKDLAVAIFGRATLATSSVDGKKSPRHAKLQDHVAKPALDPLKLDVLKGCFTERLQDTNLSEDEKREELKKIKRYLAEKIQDLCRVR
eukprot:XP_011681337.1 PREDICTED: uncharacterized protein LOC100893064 isoform X2 [Strongylocentrotus purpuratus]